MKTLPARHRCLVWSLLTTFAWPNFAQSQESAGAVPASVRDLSELDIEDLLNPVVSTASLQQERLNEAPVPVTVITPEMMESIGARTLEDVLNAYVPGFTYIIDQNERVLALHGVFASSQQQILILVNGHRLNSRAYSMAAPDHSIGLPLGKIKRIEVIRGPGSAIYGNLALTGVVNVITQDGDEIDGAVATVEGGNFGQRGVSLVAGKRLGLRHDLALWASYFAADGERVDVAPAMDIARVPLGGQARVGAFSDPPSYDLGLQYSAGDFHVLAMRRYGKQSDPFTATGVTGEAFDYPAYRRLLNTGPGLGSESNHLELGYTHTLPQEIDLNLISYYDTNTLYGHGVDAPAVGHHVFFMWFDEALGASANARRGYDLGQVGRGTILLGSQVDAMRVTDSFMAAGAAGDFSAIVDSRDALLLRTGSEVIYSVFTQIKHVLFDRLIINAGARYDYKIRRNNNVVSNLSPRAALVYTPMENLSLLLSYSDSFVDAPYWYRYNTLPSYRGGEGLTPEHLRSVQFAPSLTLLDGRLKNTVNIFYNNLYDVIFRDNAAAPTQPIYRNAGQLNTAGIEHELVMVGDTWRLHTNLTYQYAVSVKDYGARNHEIFNVPSFVANVIGDVTPLPSIFEKLRLHASVRYNGSQLSPIDVTFADAQGNVQQRYSAPNHRVSGYVLANAGLHIEDVLLEGLSGDLNVYNVFGQRYEQGGSPPHPYPQPGRWVLFTLGYRFTPA